MSTAARLSPRSPASRLDEVRLQDVPRLGINILYDPWTLLEFAYIVCQLLVNILFLTIEHFPDWAGVRPASEISQVNVTEYMLEAILCRVLQV